MVSSARSVTFAADGRIVYSGTDRDIWSIKLDGGDQRQLTNNAFNDFSPRVSPDGRTIYFASNRTGSNQIWQMNADGTNQIQVTKREGGYPQLVTPDGKYVYFFSGFTRTLWRLDVNTGEENQLTDTPVWSPAFSSDGRLVAYQVTDEQGRPYIEIMSIETRKVLKRFALGGKDPDMVKIAWSNDAESFHYAISTGGENSLWEQHLDGSKPRLLGSLGNDQIGDLSLSPNGHTLAVVRGKWIHDAVLIEGLK